MYWAILIPFKSVAFHILYGGKYMELAPLIPYVAVGTTLWSAAFGPAIMLRAIQLPDCSVAAVRLRSASCRGRTNVGFWALGRGVERDRRQHRSLFDSMYILQRKSNSISVPNPVLQRGKLTDEHSEDTPFQGLSHEAARSQIVVEHRGLKDNDVLFASFERSGNTWLRSGSLKVLTNDTAGFLNVNEVLPELGTHEKGQHVLPNGGRFIKTHHQYRPEYKRAIYLMRDLRDVMLSNWARDKEMGFSQYFDNGKGMDGYIESFLQGKVTRFGSWQSHVHGGLPLREQDRAGRAPSQFLPGTDSR